MVSEQGDGVCEALVDGLLHKIQANLLQKFTSKKYAYLPFPFIKVMLFIIAHLFTKPPLYLEPEDNYVEPSDPLLHCVTKVSVHVKQTRQCIYMYTCMYMYMY